MNLQTRIGEDLKFAMKAGDTVRVSVLRLLRSALSYRQIDKGSDLTDEDVVEVIDKEAKKRRESVAAFRSGGRNELAEKEQQELIILENYLPAALSDKEINLVVDEVITSIQQSGNQSPNLGQIMGQVMRKLKGQRADGNKVRELIHAKLR